jgi:hypothetical protein
MSRDQKDPHRQQAVTVRLHEPEREIPDGATVSIVIVEDATSIDAWSCPSDYTTEEKIAFLHYIYCCICSNLFIQAKQACESVDTSKLYIRALQWLIFELKGIVGYEDTVLSLNFHLDSLKSGLLRNMFTGESVTVDEIQETLLAITKLFEALNRDSETAGAERGAGAGDQAVYFLKIGEIKVGRMQHLANRDELLQALDLASSFDLVDIEVGFFKEALAASVVRGRRDQQNAQRG